MYCSTVLSCSSQLPLPSAFPNQKISFISFRKQEMYSSICLVFNKVLELPQLPSSSGALIHCEIDANSRQAEFLVQEVCPPMGHCSHPEFSEALFVSPQKEMLYFVLIFPFGSLSCVCMSLVVLLSGFYCSFLHILLINRYYLQMSLEKCSTAATSMQFK